MTQELTPQQKAAIEYNRRINANEFTYPEALRDKSVYDVLIMPEFAAILMAYINEQVETRTNVLETIAELKKQNKRVAENRPTIDRVMGLGLMNDPGDFAVEFAKVLNHQSKHPAEIRLYIHQLGMKAYNATIKIHLRREPRYGRITQTGNRHKQKLNETPRYFSNRNHQRQWRFGYVYGRIKRVLCST